jgi:hypothetical protein
LGCEKNLVEKEEENLISFLCWRGRSNLKLSVIIEFIKNDQRMMEKEKKWKKSFMSTAFSAIIIQHNENLTN